jgi:AcrR family transcriptional regulator
MESDLSFNSLKKQEKQARRDIIIHAAERVFANKPFNEVTIRDIAREAGISHASIYRYFPDQQTLFVEAFLKGADDIIEFLGSLINENKAVNIEKVTDKFIGYLIENDRYFRMMTHFMLDGNLSPELTGRLNSAERSLLDQLDRLFIKMEAQGEIRMLSHAYFASMNGILITFRNYPGRESEEVKNHMKKLGKIIALKFKS